MASVRLTKELRAKIISAVRSDFDEVMEGYAIPKELQKEGADIARGLLAGEHDKHTAAVAEALVAVGEVVEKHGGSVADTHIRKAFTTEVYQYESFKFLAVDPESDSDDAIIIYTATYPFQDITDENRKVLNWSPFGRPRDHSVNDPVFAEKILPSFLKERALKLARRTAIEYANNMLNACNTLAQLIRKWPDAVNVIPVPYINQMNDKAILTPRKVETPDAIMGMDEALKSIRLQAEAVKALKGG